MADDGLMVNMLRYVTDGVFFWKKKEMRWCIIIKFLCKFCGTSIFKEADVIKYFNMLIFDKKDA